MTIDTLSLPPTYLSLTVQYFDNVWWYYPAVLRFIAIRNFKALSYGVVGFRLFHRLRIKCYEE